MTGLLEHYDTCPEMSELGRAEAKCREVADKYRLPDPVVDVDRAIMEIVRKVADRYRRRERQ